MVLPLLRPTLDFCEKLLHLYSSSIPILDPSFETFTNLGSGAVGIFRQQLIFVSEKPEKTLEFHLRKMRLRGDPIGCTYSVHANILFRCS